MKDLPDKLLPFVDLGCVFTKRVGKEYVGTAPWSEKPGHLYVNGETGLWKEHHSGNGNNDSGFLRTMAELFEAALTPELAQAFARRFQLPLAAVVGVGYDGRRNAYTFAVRNHRGIVVDIRHRGLEPKSRAMSTRGCKVGLWGHEVLAKSKPGELVYVVEGETDRLAWMWLLRVLKKPGIVVAVPGAGTFKDEWATSFKDRKVRILYDNDDAGRNGAAKAVRVLMGVAHA